MRKLLLLLLCMASSAYASPYTTFKPPGGLDPSTTVGTSTLQDIQKQALSTDVSAKTSISSGSTKPRTMADRGTDIINVKDYGAVCDGSTDDTASLQLALNAAASRDHVTLLLPGMCKTTKTLTATIPNHIAIEGGGLYVAGDATTDGIDLTMSGVGKFSIQNMRFKPGPNGAGRPLSIIGNGGDIADNSDFISDVTITTSDESIRGTSFTSGIYLYGIVAYINNISVTFPQIHLVNGTETETIYDNPDVGVGLTLAGTPKGATSVLDGGGSLVSNMQGNGGFADIRFTGMSQGGQFTNIGSNWQTHIVYAGSDVVSPQSFTFNSPSSQTGWWSTNDGVLFDFEVPGGQYIINGGMFAGPAGAGSWQVLKCHGCMTVQFTNNQVNQNYPSSSPILDSGPSGSNATGWVVQNNTFGAPNTIAALNATVDTLNFAGLKSASELTFTNNNMGLLPPIVMPSLNSSSGGNMVTSSGNVWRSMIRKAASTGLGEFPMQQGILSPDWSVSAKLHGGSSPVANGYVELTLDGGAPTAQNSLATLRPFNTTGNVVEYDAHVFCYEWGENPAKYFSVFHTIGVFTVKPGATDTYTLLGQTSSTETSLYSGNGEAFTGRFVLSSASGNSPALQVVNTGTTQSTLTCSANVTETNLQ